MKGLKDYRVTVEVDVQFRDCDPLGHVNNSVYLTYLENARIAYCLGPFEMKDWKEIQFILARVEIDYRSPALPGERLVIGARILRLGGASFDMGYTIVEKKKGRLVAEAKTVQVCFDYKANKVRRIPERYREAARRIDGVS
jgi:acyl-CoA thioester hydrolase